MRKLIPAALVALTFAVALPAPESGGEELLRHTVQRGDTLWDLSGGYLDDHLMWPRIWKVNPGIADPHWIFPGQVVRIPLAAPPAATPAAAQRTAQSETTAAQRYPVDPRLTALARQKGAQPLALRVSESAAPLVATEAPAERGRAGAEANYHGYQGIGIITGQLPDGGRVLGAEQGWEQAAGGERVLIEVEAPSAPPGSRFGVYRNLGPVAALKQRGAEEEYLLADIAVIEVVSDRPGQATAVVRHAFTGLKPGDLLGPVPEQPRIVASPARELLASPATVVALHHQRLLAGPGDVVYLDAGSNQGLAPGQRLAVRGHDRELVSRSTGELIVLRVTAERAAALISAKSRHEVKTGDLVGGEW